ncbi:hypothetical protein [Paenibacillus apis]|uniref:Uncharacterized protein n=1 Tax=Paenibacillus apis TaxID=1792174 RepID=A0A920CM33_9BACL|nr:hypothetical protein [Paenibacillus apis]GIO42294.1 hypothetical protein J41TS4_20520 [Paenibacillus apis]
MKKLLNRVVNWKNGWAGKLAVRTEAVVLRLARPLQNQNGATIVEILGYALIAVLAIVVVWGLIKGWLPTFWQSITGRLDNLS